jgi:hypothetical protein
MKVGTLVSSARGPENRSQGGEADLRPVRRSQKDVVHVDADMYLCYDANMSKIRTTLTLDAEVLRAVKVRAARSGKGDSEVIEEALRRDLGLGLLERLWARNRLSDEEARKLAVEAQHRTRRRRR